MPLAGKVAKLCSGNNHLGSAWLISSSYALTAAHCVELEGQIRPNLYLEFYGNNTPVPVEVDLSETAALADWDVAILCIKAEEHELRDLVIPLSMTPCVRGQQCNAHGHPQNDLEANPAGITVNFTIVNPNHCLRRNEIQVIHLAFASTSKNLQGLSGAPLFNRDSGNQDHAVGIISEHRRNDPSNIFAIPILEIARLSDIIKEALDRSLRAKDPQRNLHIQIADGHKISWSAPIQPSDAHLLWDENGPVEQISCPARRSQMGAVDRALLRLVNHSFLKEFDSTDYEGCCSCMNEARMAAGLDVCPPYPCKSEKSDRSPCQDACEFEFFDTFSNEELAESLHKAMDAHTLEALNDQFHDCLYSGNMSGRDFKIEDDLRNRMWEIWNDWYYTLKSEKDLLRKFMVRVLSASGYERPDSEALIRIGRLSNEQIFRTILFCLALAASEIHLIPGSPEAGNFALGEDTCHACGVKKFKGSELKYRVGHNRWITKFVILPYLEEQYFTLLNSMSQYAPDTPRLDSPGAHPIMVTGDSGFYIAMENGARYVRKYFIDRKDEMITGVQTNLGTRIG